MIKKNWVIVFLLLFCWITSCKKESQSAYKDQDAMILNAGYIASGGCGWLLKIANTNTVFSPINLPQLLKTDSLEVTLTYNLTNTKFNCTTGNNFNQITITSIRKRGALRPQ